ncbi:hypothetical protein K7X08_016824 [Anisodus acutangulus]|uniref:Uncharacterized protein n=1 Tax=Anisodus acutangulus TaxID=402998 RepID=A0A9Q1LU59_9SOLA|nr:hypothetical protein K7X08_016824 [Anisodus acutangulus]
MYASKDPSRFGKELKELFDEEVTHSEDFDDNSITKDDGGHVGIGTSRDRAKPSGDPLVQLEQEKLKQCVEKMEESLKVLFTYVERGGGGFRSIEKTKKKQRTLKEKVGEVEKATDVPVPTAPVEKATNVPAQVNDKVVSETSQDDVEFDT